MYRAEGMPVLQNRMFNSQAEALNSATGDIRLVQDSGSGLIFNRAFRPELMHYDADYQNEQSVSAVFKAHLAEASKVIVRNFPGNELIEVGCGKAYFLEHLQSLGFSMLGFDPTYEGSNPNVLRKYFDQESGLHAEGIILRHVLEHVQDPFGFLGRIRDANGGKGRIYIEVPCFEWICRRRAWFDIFYEHVNYFRLADFERLFGHVYEMGHAFEGQYLYVVADLSTLRMPQMWPADRFRFPADFSSTIDQYAGMLKRSAAEAGSAAKSAVWGGASKGVIFALFMQRAGARIDCVVDINPAKQGKYLALTGHEVISPRRAISMLAPGSKVLVMNGNYSAEIRAMTNNEFNYLVVDDEII